MNNEIKDKKKIFIVEDEPDILALIAINLEKAGYEVDKFSEAGAMLAMLKKKIPDLLILDLMLPDHDGLDVCKLLKNNKKYPDFPIIMVTARTEELDVVLGLELGADDYIAKPFSPRELVARVKAVLRRTKQTVPRVSRKLVIGDILTIDTAKYEVMVNNEKIQLTATEFMILKILAEKPGWVFPREKILHTLWGDEKDVFDRTVDVHIKNLREKLGPAGDLIKNVRGVGYKIE
ncbi:MAG: response regulator transcription factor [Acidobacteria bacterium]|jgi:two-component system phosphate regulon response regulator PhoB/two-component system alkaline phosphatase synthesis response regulator PhoP|nr:response regulator transcription factor [Acidobacteriota bacterium]